MKVVIASLNAKFIHSSLAIRCLKAYCQSEAEIEIRDYSINDNLQNITADIYRIKPDIIGFSCYIWNIKETLEIAEVIKTILPDVKIVLGGPEVSFESEKYLNEYPLIDAVICGEGEETFREFIQAQRQNSALNTIKGLSYRDNIIIVNQPRPLIDSLDEIPFPYDSNDFAALKNKIVYYETARGCAYSCSYCLSSTVKGLRFLSSKRVNKDIKTLIKAGVKQIKFVDRTFNISKQHAMVIWQIILDNINYSTNFHFEIAADLLDEEMIELLEKFPPGLVQFEIGVQSINLETLKAIERKSNIDILSSNVKKLRKNNNIHLHLDLIAGLPYENLQSFKKSFNTVYDLSPHQLQLGFLKVLKGTKIHREAHEMGIVARNFPPYEVLQTKWLSYDDLLLLKDIEEVIEGYFNTTHYSYFLSYIFKKWQNGAFALYQAFSEYIRQNVAEKMSFSTKTFMLLNFACELWPEEKELQKEILTLDLLSNQKHLNLPEWLGFNVEEIKRLNASAVKNEAFLERYLPDKSPKDWRDSLKNYLFVPITPQASVYIFDTKTNLLKFDYTVVDKITGRVKVELFESNYDFTNV